MKWSLLSIVLLSGTLLVCAESADDAYIQIYSALQQADSMNQNGQYRSAADKYLEVQTALKRFQQINPTWNQKIINYRLNYTTERLASIVKFLPAPAAKPAPVVAAVPAETNPSVSFQLSSSKGHPPEELQTKIETLNSDVQRLETEKTNLEAKLKEALSMQPAAVDPAQLASAQRKLTALEKERDLLKVSLEQEKARVSKADQDRIDPQMMHELERERDELKQQLNDAVATNANNESRYQERIRLAEEKLKLLDQLQSERDELDKKLQISLARATAVENDRKASKTELKEMKKLQDEKEATEKKFYALAKEVSDLQADREKEIKEHQAALARIQKLEEERDSLQTQVAALKATPTTSVAATAAVPGSNSELEQLKARLAVYEAKATPLSPEELALFKKPDGSTASAFYLATRPTVRDLPENAQKLIEQADTAFSEQRYHEAARKYEQVLAKNEGNVYTLANLASTQIELNDMEEAAANLKRALAIDPNDPFSLLLLGKIKMNENKMDEALSALSRAAELNPDSAETQNCLGIALSEKGLLVAAEAALRKAIQLQPNYANAHHNLAIIYATQKPPFIELARWHYEKALSLGHAKNPELEKIVAGK